ncbi:MAG: hypothetical protein KIT31_15195 [Deltaproteobacteria bacterium]|nr:hypothetical protein [Deltaproteobacteria bacterium]
MNRLAALLLLPFASLAACTSESDFADVAAGAEGIYRVTSYTRNDQACAPGGSSLLGKDKFAFAVSRQLFGISVLDIYSCENPADCRAKLAALDANGSFSLDFSFTLSDVEAGVLVGAGASTGFGDGGVCREGEITKTRLVLEGTSLRLQQEVTVADDYPADRDGFCTTTAAQAAAAGNACSELEVFSADFVEPL